MIVQVSDGEFVTTFRADVAPQVGDAIDMDGIQGEVTKRVFRRPPNQQVMVPIYQNGVNGWEIVTAEAVLCVAVEREGGKTS